MSETNMMVLLGLETSQYERDLIDFRNKVDEVASRWQRVKLTVANESRNLMQSMYYFVNLARSIISNFGVSLGTMGDALLNMIASTIQGVLAMQYAYAAGGPVGWAMMGVAGVALMFALHAEAYATLSIDTMKNELRGAQAAMNNISGILGAWRF